MFYNPGGKLKAVAIVMFVILVIVSFVLAFNYGREDVGVYRRIKGDIKPSLFLGILVGGLAFSYVSALALYGFGEMVENSQELPEITEKLSKLVPQSTSKPKEPIPAGRPVRTFENGDWECPKCGERNPFYKEKCRNCGAKS